MIDNESRVTYLMLIEYIAKCIHQFRLVRIHFAIYTIGNNQYNAFWGDQRSERDGGPCTCEIATGYLQITCARHPANR